MNIKQMQWMAHRVAVEKGWWPNGTELNKPWERFTEAIALIHSEVSEALEEYRSRGKNSLETIYREGDGKPEGLGPELADILIRVGDLAEALGVNLDEEVFRKMEFNKTRPHRHGDKHA